MFALGLSLAVDDPSSRQEKMLQQRQLALRRQRDLAKSSLGPGVTAQLNTPLDTSAAQNMQKKALGWGKMLQAGIDGSACSSNMMRIIVPADEEELLSSPRQHSLCKRQSPLQAAVQDTGLVAKAGLQRSGSEYQKMPGMLQTQRSFQESTADKCWSSQSETAPQDKTPRRKLFRMLEPTLDNCWDSQTEAHSNEKSSSRNFWRPWGSSKRNNVATETAVEKRVLVLPAADEDTHEQFGAIWMDRAGTPWEPPCDSSALDESMCSDVSSIPGLLESLEAHGQGSNADAVIASAENNSMGEQGDPVSKVYDDNAEDGQSVDSGIDQTLRAWKLHENQSPNQKKSRFNRFISTVQAPKLWRASKADVNAVTRIEVNPAINPDPVIDVD